MTDITGTTGGDLLIGTFGDDLILGLGGDDRLLGQSGNDTIDGGDGNDSITGDSGTDNIQGGAGDDDIDITTNDTIDGGAGNDILSVDLFGIPVLTGINFNHQNFSFSFFETLFTSTIINVEAVDFFRLTNFDDVVFYGPTYTFFVNIRGQNGNDTITGGSGSNLIFGEGGNDILIGGSGSNRFNGGVGNDTITGNSTNDTFTIEDGTGAVTINAGTGVATGTSTGIDQFSGIERFNVFAGSIDFTGDDQANFIQASAATATLRGGNGNDTYLILNSSAVIIESATGGIADQVFAQSDYVLPDNVENIAFEASVTANFNLTGNSGDNIIRGNSGNNLLVGGAGADQLDGQGGTDTASYARSPSGVTINLATRTYSGGDANGDTLAFIEAIIGSTFADTITGDAGDNTIEGGAGNDVLVGGSGIDTVSYLRSSFGVTVRLDILTAQNTVQQGLDTISGFENILGSGADDVLFGDAASNVITAGGGFDTLVSGGGTNTLIGGTGGDTYFVQGVNDIVTEVVGGGYDIVLSQVNFMLAAGSEVEALAVNTTAGISLIGNEFGQNLTGNAGSDTLNGGGGNDLIISGGGTNTLIGGSGADIYYAQGLNDIVTEDAGGGFDVVLASGNLTLAASSEVEVIAVNTASGVTIIGSNTNQTILGGAGNDRLIGGRGNDTLLGSGGADTFMLLNTNADRDFIRDFTSGTDKLEISAALFGGGLAAGVLSASQFRSGAGIDIAATAAHRFIYNSSTGNLWFDADGSGAGASVLMGNLTSVPPLTAADFLIAV